MIRCFVLLAVLGGQLQAFQSSSTTPLTPSPPPPSPILEFVAGPGTVGGDINQSTALEWTLDGVPVSYHYVAISYNWTRVFQYTPYTGKITITGNTDPRFSVYNTTTKGVGFHLERLIPDDAGRYTCELTGIVVEDVSSATLLVHDVPTIPTIAETPGDYVEGETNVTLTCTATSTSLPLAHRLAMLYTWSRNGVDIDRTGPPERHTVLGDSGETLAISPVHHTDATYTCRASENGTQLTSEETEVTLDVLYGPLNISIHPENITLAFNETIVVKAYATCHPTCDFEWQLGSDVISVNSTLTLDGSEISSSETYKVTASNEHWSLSLSVTVTYIPGEVPEETLTTESTVTSLTTEPTISDNPPEKGPSAIRYDVIAAVFITIATVSLAANVAMLVIAYRKGYFKRKSEDMAEVDPLPPVYANAEILQNIVSTAGNQSSDINGVYELTNQATREPASPPSAQVYAALAHRQEHPS